MISHIAQIPFPVTEVFSDPSDILWAQRCFRPTCTLKTKKIRSVEPPYMNKTLKKALLNKPRFLHKWKRTRTRKSWEVFLHKEIAPLLLGDVLFGNIFEKGVKEVL